MCISWAIWLHRLKITRKGPSFSQSVYLLSGFMTVFLRHRPQVIMGFPVGWSGGMVAESDICGEICHCFCLFSFHGIHPWNKLEILHDSIVGTDNCAAITSHPKAPFQLVWNITSLSFQKKVFVFFVRLF